MPASIPLELQNEALSYLRGNSTTLKAVRQSSMDLAFLSGPHAFANLVFKGVAHILKFFDLASAPCSTIPETLRCDSICLKNTGDIDDSNLAKIVAKMSQITLTGTLTFKVDEGDIPLAALQLSSVWGAGLRDLTISGGSHRPSALFGCLSLFPSLRSLVLENIHIEEEVWVAGHNYKLPATVTHLSLVHCATIWAFLRSKVQPGGGLDGVQDLYIRDLFFNGEEGIPEMKMCLRELHGVRSLILDPLHHYRFPNFNCHPYDVYQRSWEATILQMRGLKVIRVNCANLPPKTAAESVCMYALQFAESANVSTIVEIYAPQTLDLSRLGACEDLLDATIQPRSATTTGYGDSNLVIRCLPGRLPRSMDDSRQVTVSGYPVAFGETDWEEAIGSRLNGGAGIIHPQM